MVGNKFPKLSAYPLWQSTDHRLAYRRPKGCESIKLWQLRPGTEATEEDRQVLAIVANQLFPSMPAGFQHIIQYYQHQSPPLATRRSLGLYYIDGMPYYVSRHYHKGWALDHDGSEEEAAGSRAALDATFAGINFDTRPLAIEHLLEWRSDFLT